MSTTAGDIRLVSFSHGAGCGCKLGPTDLTEVLQALGPQLPVDHRLLGDPEGLHAAMDRDRRWRRIGAHGGRRGGLRRRR